MEYLRNSECWQISGYFISHLIFVASSDKLQRGIWQPIWVLHLTSDLRHVFRKCSEASKKQWMLDLSNLCHCAQHSWKLISRDLWSSRNRRKPLSKQKCVLRKCCGASQKQWMLELSNLCHCVQHSWKLTSRDLWSFRNERKPLSKQKCVSAKILWGISEMVNARAFKPLPLCSAPPENLLVGIYGALGMKESHFLSKNVLCKNTVGYLRNGEC